MFVSIYYKPSLFNAHTMILSVHNFMNVNKLCLNQVWVALRWPWAVDGVLNPNNSVRPRQLIVQSRLKVQQLTAKLINLWEDN